jgi:hypothetical protein
MTAAFAVFFTLGTKRRAYIPQIVWWLCLMVGAVAVIFSLFHSTAPSFAPRVTAIGKVYDYVELKRGRDTYYSFRLVPITGEPINIETAIIVPDWGTPEIFNGRTFRVVYLQDGERSLKNEAIDIEILVGKHSGFHDALDARPGGTWLGIPIGAVFGAFGLLGLRYRKDDIISASDQKTDDLQSGTLKIN